MVYSKNEIEELATTYASLILHDSEVKINASNINSLLAAAGVKVAPFWPKLFEDAFEKKSIGDYLVSAPAAGAPAASAAAPAAAAPAAVKKEEPKKEEKKEESDEDMGFGLFD